MQPSIRKRLTPWLSLASAWLWLVVFPLWQDGSYSRIPHAKWVGLLVLSGLTLLLSLPLLRRPRLRPSLAFAAGFAGWMLLAACFGAYHHTVYQGRASVWFGTLRYEGMLTKLIYLLLFLLMRLHRPKPAPLMMGVSLAVTGMTAVAALQYAGINALGLFPAGRSIATNYEFQSTIGNIDMVSGVLSLLIPLLLGYAAVHPAWYALTAGSLGTAWLLATGVQGGRVALAAIAAVLLLLMLRRPTLRSGGCLALAALCAGAMLRSGLQLPWLDGTETVLLRFSGRVWGWAAAAAALIACCRFFRCRPGQAVPRRAVLTGAVIFALSAVLLLALLPLPPASGALWEAHELLNLRPQDAFGSYRLGVWRVTLAMAAEHPMLGHGADTFWFALRDRLAAMHLTFPEAFDNPHNELIALLFEGGVPALLCYLGLVLTVLKRLLRRSDPLSAALLLGLTGYLAQAQFSFSICLVAPLFWAALGLGDADGG